jgi:hypothetical protein
MLPDLVNQLDLEQDKVIVVDNDSQDGSYELLTEFVTKHQYEGVVYVVAAEKNGGFSYGNNLAITYLKQVFNAQPEFVLLLNPDTALKDGSLSRLLEFMQQHSDVGIAGSRLETEQGDAQHSAFRFHTIMSELLSGLCLGFLDKRFEKYLVSGTDIADENVKTDWVAGASMLVRYKVIEDIGLMDEQYFLYFEETDFCLQAAKAGWECWYVPSSQVVHYVGQSTGVVSGDSERRRRPKYWFESRQYYFVKNHGVIYTMLADFIWSVSFLLRRIRYIIQGKPDDSPEHMLGDFLRNSIFLSWLQKD